MKRMYYRYVLNQKVRKHPARTWLATKKTYVSVAIVIIIPLIAILSLLIAILSLHHSSNSFRNATNITPVPGQNYNICDKQSQYLTSPWTYDALASGSRRYTVAQYEALPGYGTTLPPLPSYISSQSPTTEAAVIYAPGSAVNNPAYDFPNTPIVQYFEGGRYGQINLATVSGDEFFGGSATGFPEPIFNDAGSAGGIGAGNDTLAYSGGASTLAATANSGTTTVTTSTAIPGYINYITFADGSTYSIASHSGTSITLNHALSSTQASGSSVWANRAQPIAEVASSASQGATTITLNASSIPLVPHGTVVVGSDNYHLTTVSGTQSDYTVGVGSLNTAASAHTPIYYNLPAGDVTVEYLNINDDQHITTGTIDTGSGWTVEHNYIHDGYSTPGKGVAIYGGDRSTIEYNCISKMGDYGINAFGANDKFAYNEVYESNYKADPGCGCSGGGKWWGTLNADIIDNAFINDGIGGGGAIWLDNGNSGTLISGNYFDKTYGNAISSETGYNLDITNNLFLDDNWGSGNGCGNSNCVGAVSMNSSGGATVPGSRYENQVTISSNQFINDWGGVDIWQAGARSCENSGEGWPNDAAYCSGGYPNTSTPAGGGQYYFSHIGDDAHGGSTTLAQAVSPGSTTVLVHGAEAIDDQIGFSDPASTTTTTTTNVSSFKGSGTVRAASTTGFPSAGQLRVGTSAAWSDAGGSYTGAILSYTGTTANSFTGVSLVRGSGTLAGPILQVQPYKVTAETCYANDCALTVTPALTTSEAANTIVTNAGTCQLYATSTALPSGPLSPTGESYWEGCQWEAKDISITGNTFVFEPSVIASSAPLTGGTTTSCSASNTNNCGTNFMAYQPSGEAPFDSGLGENALMSSSSFTRCPSWDSGCTSDPLNNINALSDPPRGTSSGNGAAPGNNVWSDNTYIGPWLWNAYIYGTCGQLPSNPASGKSMPSGACQTRFSGWQSDWQQDAGSSYNPGDAKFPSTHNNVSRQPTVLPAKPRSTGRLEPA